MRRYHKMFAAIVGLMLAAFFCGIAVAQEAKTITGKINDEFQLEGDDGKVYEIDESEKGLEVSEMIGKKVSITGKISKKEGALTIEVTDYKIIE